MVERLVSVFSLRNRVDPVQGQGLTVRGSILEHIRFRQGHLAVEGERMMAEGGPLRLEEDFFGADEALTNYAPGRDEWVATLMVSGDDLLSAQRRRDRVLREVRDRLGVISFSDDYPDGQTGQVK